MDENNVTIDYDVVTEFSGHQPNKGVKLKEAAKDIFNRVKEKAQQVAVKGEFISFSTIDELEEKLERAVGSGYRITVFDENVGG